MADNAHEITANATLPRDAAVNTPMSERRTALVSLAADCGNVGFKPVKCACDEARAGAAAEQQGRQRAEKRAFRSWLLIEVSLN